MVWTSRALAEATEGSIRSQECNNALVQSAPSLHPGMALERSFPCSMVADGPVAAVGQVQNQHGRAGPQDGPC